MQYMGGKARIAKHIVTAILQDTDSRDVWFEPFVGGGNVMEIASPHFKRSIGADAHEDLILMWQHVTQGGEVPEFVSREEYQALRRAESSWMRGFVGFGASFGGKWFGGYGHSQSIKKDGNRRDEACRASYRSVTRQGAVFQANHTVFVNLKFGEMSPVSGSVIYCDPPYAGTTGYVTGSFDYNYFYTKLAEWARTCAVYVSEYSVPENVGNKIIWTGEKRSVLEKGDNVRVVVENLYRILPS